MQGVLGLRAIFIHSQKFTWHGPLFYYLAPLPTFILLIKHYASSSLSSSFFFDHFGSSTLLACWPPWCLLAMALYKSLFWATLCELFFLCHFKNLSTGFAFVKGNLLIKVICTPLMKWEMAIALTYCTHFEGRQYNLNNINIYCWNSPWQLTLIAKFHLGTNQPMLRKIR